MGPCVNKLKVGGRFIAECVNPDGSVAWRAPIHFPNGVTNGGLNDILSVYFASGTQKTTWYVGLIDNAGFSALAAADTISSHAGWSESTAYSESVRQTWTPGSVSGQTVTNPSAAAFTMNATTTVKGAFIVSNSTKGGTTGQLWATGAFSTNQVLSSGQVLRIFYTCAASGT